MALVSVGGVLAASRTQAQPATSAWRAMHAMRPRADPAAELRRGDALVAAHRYAEALAAYENAAGGRLEAAVQAGRARALFGLGHRDLAVETFRRAVSLARGGPNWKPYSLELAEACRLIHDPECASRVYVAVLGAEPDANTAERYRSLAWDAFGHGYDFAPHEATGTDWPPWLRSGPVLSLGLGTDYGGFGAQLGYEIRPRRRKFVLTPFVSAGVSTVGGGLSPLFGPLAGAIAGYGGENRWVLSASYGFVAFDRIKLYGTEVGARGVYGMSVSAGYEWRGTTGIFLRWLAGVSMPIDHSVKSSFPALSFGLGWKP